MEYFPFNHEEAILALILEHHEDVDQVWKWLSGTVADDLLAIRLQFDLDELADIELPSPSVDRLDLNCYMAAELTGRDYVVMRYVTSERRRKKVEPA